MKNTGRFSYRDFQSELFILGFVPIVVYIVHIIKGGDFDWLSVFCGAGLVTGIIILVRSKAQKKDVKDEMAQENLAKADKITLFLLCAALFVSVLLNDYLMDGLIDSDFCWLIVTGAIALRSLLFTFFDAPVSDGGEDE